MAEHATEYANATGNDYAEHERTYANIMKLAKITTAGLILIMISLAIGGVSGAWTICGIGVLLALVSGTIGAMNEKGTVLPLVVSTVVVLALWLMFG